jgi:hypothetical protein
MQAFKCCISSKILASNTAQTDRSEHQLPNLAAFIGLFPIIRLSAPAGIILAFYPRKTGLSLRFVVITPLADIIPKTCNPGDPADLFVSPLAFSREKEDPPKKPRRAHNVSILVF